MNNDRLQHVWNLMQNQPGRDVWKFSAASVCGPVTNAIEMRDQIEDNMSSVSQHQGRDVESGALLPPRQWNQSPVRLPV